MSSVLSANATPWWSASAWSSGFGSSKPGAAGDPSMLSHLDLAPSKVTYPFYARNTPSLIPGFSDKYLSLLAPIVIYWLASAWFSLLDHLRLPFFEKYRLHEPEEITKRNKVSARRVVVMVILQQILQTVLGVLILVDEETIQKEIFADHVGAMRQLGFKVAGAVVTVLGRNQTSAKLLHAYGTQATEWLYWWGIPTAQLFWAFFVMDAWEYFLHRAFHESRFLYRHFHSHHHRLYVPYAFGALYNHPLEGLLLDSAGAAVSHAAALMTVRQAIFLFTISTLKTVCDHGGYAFPAWLDPLHLIFPNNAEYHDVHHQMQGLRYNYSQPFFVHFDALLGTRMGADKFKKMKEVNERKWKEEKAKMKGAAEGAKGALDAQQKVDEKARQLPAVPSRGSSSAIAEERKELRRRGANGEEVGAEDVVDAKLADGSSPFVTTSKEEYRAQAGVKA